MSISNRAFTEQKSSLIMNLICNDAVSLHLKQSYITNTIHNNSELTNYIYMTLLSSSFISNDSYNIIKLLSMFLILILADHFHLKHLHIS